MKIVLFLGYITYAHSFVVCEGWSDGARPSRSKQLPCRELAMKPSPVILAQGQSWSHLKYLTVEPSADNEIKLSIQFLCFKFVIKICKKEHFEDNGTLNSILKIIII